MKDIYSKVANMCGFVEESTQAPKIVKKAKGMAKKRSQDLYLESVTVEEDEDIIPGDIEDEDVEIDIDTEDEVTEGDDERFSKIEGMLEKILDKLGDIEIEDDSEEDSEDDIDLDIEDEDGELIEGEGEMAINVEEQDIDPEVDPTVQECKEESVKRITSKSKALKYLKQKKQEMVLESIKLESDKPTRRPLVRR